LDTLIYGGTVIDGTNSARYRADIGIVGDRIVAIGDLSGVAAKTRIDASGKIVAPGFIDSHTHDDQALLSKPDMIYKISQGVTTVVTGNCGISIAPLKTQGALPAPLNLLDDGKGKRFETFHDYLEALRRRPAATNVAAMVGHTTLRLIAMDSLERSATPEEIDTMQELLVEALNAGAIGISTGTFYPLAAHATTAEIIEVCRPLTNSGGIYATHMRDEADHTMASLDETFHIGRELDSMVVISHHKLQREQNFGKSSVTLPYIRAAMQRQKVGMDCYPYNASSTMLHTDPARLQGRVMIASSEPHPEKAGMDLDLIAEQWQVSKEAAAKRLQPGSAIYFSMHEQDVRNIMAFEDTMIGSDGIPTGEKPHPRLWGTFPRVLGKYSRDIGLFPLETAVWKMTGLTAKNFNFPERGTLKTGNYADIVVFDAETVKDTASFESPCQFSEGIEMVFVNGAITWQNGKHLGTRAGRVITRQSGQPQSQKMQ
jgi:N-acyl-D-amino-acid deacylase